MENTLIETMYELPSMDGDIKKVVVDASVITEGSRPLYVYEDEAEQKSASGSST